MKHPALLLIFIFIFPVCSLRSQNRSIQFVEKPFIEIISIAKKQNKMIFMDAYTTWCGPCKWIAAKIFTNDTIADFYNKEFICCHFDMEKGEGLELAVKYQVQAYPTLLFINPEGQVVHLRVGAPRKVQDYIDMAHVAKTPGAGYTAYMEQYRQGNRDPQFMLQYFDRLQGAYQPVNEPLKQYFDAVPEAEIFDKINWKIFELYSWDVDSRIFQLALKNKPKLDSLYTPVIVNTKINGVFAKALYVLSRSRNFNEANYNALKQKILNSGVDEAPRIIEEFESTMLKH